jgi:hypothetical protein
MIPQFEQFPMSGGNRWVFTVARPIDYALPIVVGFQDRTGCACPVEWDRKGSDSIQVWSTCGLAMSGTVTISYASAAGTVKQFRMHPTMRVREVRSAS